MCIFFSLKKEKREIFIPEITLRVTVFISIENITTIKTVSHHIVKKPMV